MVLFMYDVICVENFEMVDHGFQEGILEIFIMMFGVERISIVSN